MIWIGGGGGTAARQTEESTATISAMADVGGAVSATAGDSSAMADGRGGAAT